MKRLSCAVVCFVLLVAGALYACDNPACTCEDCTCDPCLCGVDAGTSEEVILLAEGHGSAGVGPVRHFWQHRATAWKARREARAHGSDGGLLPHQPLRTWWRGMWSSHGHGSAGHGSAG
jgi:hypothetical protein